MKLAYVTAKFPFAPAEQFLEPEVRSLAALADVVVVATRPERRTSCYPDLGVESLYLALFDRDVLCLASREFIRNPAAAAKVFAEVVFGRASLRSRIVNALVFPKALAFAQEVQRLGIDHIHAAWLTTPATVGYVAARLTGAAFSLSAHSHDVRAENLLKEKAEFATFLRVISERNSRYIRNILPQRLGERCRVVHLGVEVPRTITEPPAARPTRILCSARLAYVKGHADLLAALGILRKRELSFECDLAGDGPLREAIEREISRLSLGQHVRILGYVPHDRLTRAQADGEYDVVVLASNERPEEHEGIPVALMEAMAAGLPVVATNTGSIAELVNERCGILVPQRDPPALAEALARMIAGPAARRAMGARGRRRVAESFEATATTAQLARLIGIGAPRLGSGQAPRGTQVPREVA